ncbi:MAG: xanthine dehydrogenase family protein molybdopterin-binding subunit, partial [Azospirillaceae bacterium]
APWTGRSLARLEDAAYLTGAGAYLDDLAPAATLFLAVVRSPVARGRIAGLESGAAAAMPGVAAVVTAADLAAAGIGILPLDVAAPAGAVAGPAALALQPVLAAEAVRFVGEAVAFVVADTAARAVEAAEAVIPDIEPEPAVVDLAEADTPARTVLSLRRGDTTTTEAAFAAASRTVALEVRANRVHAQPLEPRGCVAIPDAGADTVELWVPTQRPHGLRDLLAGLFGWPAARLRVRVPDTGGGFGMKNPVYPEYVMALHAAERLGRPVKWVSSRTEGFVADVHGRDNLFTLEAALDAAGRIAAIRAHRRVSLGAYAAPRAMVPVANGLAHLTGVYAIPAAAATVTAHLTDTACTSAYRGAGRPEHVHACERFVDHAARTLGEDPIAFRRRHLPEPGARLETPLGAVYDGPDFAGLLDRALARIDHEGFEARRAGGRAAGRLRGIGVALFAEALHGAGRPAPAALAAVDGVLTVDAGTVSTGHGHATAFRQIAADILKVDPATLGFRQGDTGVMSDGLGTAASWSLTLGGGSVLLAARAAVERARALVAGELEADPADIEHDADGFRVRGTDLVRRWPDILARVPDFRADGVYDGPAETTPAGCHACEVAVDPETGAIALLAHVMVQDSGDAVNPALVAGQLHGGAAQGLGQAWMEAVRHDADGQLVSGSLMDYALPRAADLPAFDVTLAPSAEAGNPLGVRGVGEAAATGAPAAFVNAVIDALAPLTGPIHLDMPLTPETVWRAIGGVRSDRAGRPGSS